MTLKIFNLINLYRSALVIMCIVVHNNMTQIILIAHIFIFAIPIKNKDVIFLRKINLYS